MSRPQQPRIQVGDVVQVEEPGYMYGTGPLLLRVTAVGEIRMQQREAWVTLYGRQLWPDGQEINGTERYALVRLVAISPKRPSGG